MTNPTAAPTTELRYVVGDRAAVIPLVYGRSTAFVRPNVHGWWEFGKSSASFADLRVQR